MIKYKETSATGNAGEYYFAYWISKYFQWPCRLLDIDLGIDAQIEILDKNNHTSGNFLAVQIKTTETNKENVSIELRNLEYWKTMDDIVILVSITLNLEPQIYWKVINDEKIEQYILEAKSNDSNKTTIKFDDKNLLVKENKNIFELLPYKNTVLEANSIIDNIIDTCTNINNKLWDEENETFTSDRLNNGLWDIEDIIDNFNNMCYEDDKLNEYLNKFPKIEQHLSDLPTMNDSYQLAEDNVREVVRYLCGANCDSKFEYKERWESSYNHITVMKMFEEKC